MVVGNGRYWTDSGGARQVLHTGIGAGTVGDMCSVASESIKSLPTLAGEFLFLATRHLALLSSHTGTKYIGFRRSTYFVVGSGSWEMDTVGRVTKAIGSQKPLLSA